MTQRYDIRIKAAYVNANNDIEIFASDMQHVKDIINANEGSFKETPSLGVGVTNYLLGSGIEQTLARKTIIQLQSDKYPCTNPIVSTTGGKLTINPNLDL